MAAYGTIAGTQALLPAVGLFGVAGAPTEAQALQWLDEGAAIINRSLASAGYAVPVVAGATVYAELTALNNLYAAAYVLLSQGLDTATGGEEQRSELWLNRFDARLAALVAADLTGVGATVATTSAVAPRRRARFVQLKRIDGYSAPHDDVTADYDMDN
jgi:hypothetical protein